MLKTLYFYPIVVLSLFIVPVFLIKINYLERKGKTKERIAYIHKVTHTWAKFVMKLNGSKIIVNGLENIPKDQTVLFMSNHQGYFDIPLLISEIDVPKGFIAKKELEKIPGISMWMRYLQCIFMDRSNMRKSAEAIVQGVKILKSGYSMVIFPEGTRSKCNTVGEFKSGSFKLATKAKVPIVPITIDGSYKLLEKQNWGIRARDVVITVHKPVDVTSMSKEEISNLPETIRNTIANAIK